MNAHLDENSVVVLQRLLQERNPAALQQLYEFGPRLELSVQRKFGSFISHEDIQDIVADALVRAYQTGDRFDPAQSRLTTWLNQLVHYEALTFLRKRRMLDGRSPDDLEGQLVAVMEQQPSRHLFTPSSRLAPLLQRLPDGYAEVLLRYYYDGLNEERIAELFETTPRAIRTRLSRARRRLRALIDAEAPLENDRRDEEDEDRN